MPLVTYDSLPTLYQRDSKGKIRQWSVRTEDETIIVEHGIQGGKLQTQITKAKPKNLGKVNETTAEQQAVIEAKAKHTKQILREDYAEDVEKAGLQTRPMLANDYLKVPHRLRIKDTLAQPKLDGLRLVAGYRWADRRSPELFEMLTRKGETHNVNHLIDDAHSLLRRADGILVDMGYPEGTCIGVDGEVYLHNHPLPWINSRAKKYYEGETEQLEYHVFDLVCIDVPFWVRHDVLSQAFGEIFQSKLVLVPYIDLNPEDPEAHMEDLRAMFVEEGYEGLILRHRDGMYKMGTGGTRSADLFKFKEFFDEECLIIGITEDLNGNAMWRVRRKPTLDFGANVEVDVTPKRSHDERKRMLLHPEEWVGKWATIKYQSVTPYGSLQFPSGLELRECDDLGEPIK